MRRAKLVGKTVLVRANFSHGVSQELGQTVRKLAYGGARVAVIAGFGSPGGDVNPVLSLLRFAMPLERLADVRVTFLSECVGPIAELGLNRVPFGEAALLENVRFHSDMRRDSRSFALRLSALGDFFVITGPVPKRPIAWLTELSAILPAPDVPASHLLSEDH